MPVDPSQLQRILDTIKSQYGRDQVYDPNTEYEIKRIPIGDPMLDWAIGGGLPIGRYCHFYGGFGSAKTLTAYKAIASAQRMGLTAALYDVEKQYDPLWAARWGIDTEKLVVIRGSVIEEIGDEMESLLGSVHVHVVDSVAAGVSLDEMAGESKDWHPAIGARVWGKVLRRVNYHFDQNENMVILIN